MNKQALAFLTLFSLILMLSVYYVTLPPDTTSVMKSGDKETKAEDKGKEKNADVLKEEVEKKKNEELDKNSGVVSDPNASEDDKQKALETIEDLKDSKQIETKLVELLKDAGYKGVVEISDKTCKVSLFEVESSKDTASKAMKVVNDFTKNKYLIEVTFK